jgi:hypothetical protein
MEALVDSARGAPPEFAADALIRLASLDKLDKSWRADLLEEAFRLGGAAQQPIRRRPAIFKFDGPTGFLERAWSQDLDAQSLQLRAIEGILPLDRRRARELWARMPPLKLPRLDCKDLLVYDVTRFYAVLGRLAGEAFTPAEIEKEEPFKLLQRYAAIQSPAQLGPMAHLLASAKLKDGQFDSLLGSYLAGMKELSGDDRSFTFARPAGAQIRELVEAIKRREGTPLPLLETYRAYLVRHLTGARCADNVQVDVKLVMSNISSAMEKSQEALNAAGYFNDSLRQDPLQPINTMEEQTPSKTEAEAEGVKGCDSSQCSEIGKKYRGLIFKNDQTPYTAEEKASAEWHNKLKEFLAAVADWKQDTDATAAEHFRFKCSVYSELFSLVPNGSDREMLVRANLGYLKQSSQAAASRIEWFYPVNLLIVRIALDPLGLGPLLEDLRKSGDPVVSLYARLEQLVPRTPDKVLPLL